jgi:hypothetical protein
MTNQPSWPSLDPRPDPWSAPLPPTQPTGPYGYTQPAPPPMEPYHYAAPTSTSQVVATSGPGSPPVYPAQPHYGYASPYPVFALPRTSGLAVASMILGIVGLAVSWFTLGIPSILAVVFGHVSLNQIRHDANRGGRGIGIAGLVTGYVGIAGGVLWLAFIGLALA